MRLLSNITFLIAVLATAAGCGGKNPIQPPPPPPPGPQLELSCPTAMTRVGTSPQGTDVHFDAPTPTGGREPYSVQCEPGSSSVFPFGETTVRCTATDADKAQASCGFAVTVRASQTIAKTKFMAFGDSITLGVTSLAPFIMLGVPDTYPFKLEQMLRERYPSQTIEVFNRGLSGERTDRALPRLITELDAVQPQVMLLLEGVNAINALSTSVQTAAIGAMIEEAQRRRIDVIIATIMPMFPGTSNYKPDTPSKIAALNANIVSLAIQYNLGPPVDLFGLFDANRELMGADGLHPSITGQTRIAEAFRDEIVRRYGTTSTTSLSTSISTTLRRMR